MSSLFLDLVLIFLMFKCASTYTDLFSESSDSDDITAPLLFTPNDQETILGGDLSFNPEDTSRDLDLFTSDPNEPLLNANLISSCSDGNNGQPSKLRVRDACQANPNTAIKVPKLPDISEDLKEADGPNRQFVWVIDVKGVRMTADEPDYYCVLHRPFYSKPVCGSGKLSDRWYGHPPLYLRLDYSKLILPPNSLWHCPESEFFCCRDWTRYSDLSPTAVSDPNLGTGYDCINLKDDGWEGYDSERNPTGVSHDLSAEDLIEYELRMEEGAEF